MAKEKIKKIQRKISRGSSVVEHFSEKEGVESSILSLGIRKS